MNHSVNRHPCQDDEVAIDRVLFDIDESFLFNRSDEHQHGEHGRIEEFVDEYAQFYMMSRLPASLSRLRMGPRAATQARDGATGTVESTGHRRQHCGNATPWDNGRASLKIRDVIRMLEDVRGVRISSAPERPHPG
jgi:hypothetical protein